MTRQTAHEIDQEAADWAAKVDRGLSTEEQARLEGWLDEDARRVGAFGLMRAAALESDRAAALGPGFDPTRFAGAVMGKPSRRQVLVRGGAIAASVAASATVAGLVGWRWSQRGRFQTRKGEVRQIALQDGSVVTLNTASLVAVSFTRTRRDIWLLNGEALFDVASDKARPFVVTAGATQATAVGTSFTVRNLPGRDVVVLVREGVVQVARSDTPTLAPLRLVADMQATSAVETAGAPAPKALTMAVVPAPDVQRALAWRDGRMAFEGEPLGYAVAEFARYSDTRIVVDDPALAREEIAGLYQSTDPVGFAQSIATSLGAHTDIAEGEIRIYR